MLRYVRFGCSESLLDGNGRLILLCRFYGLGLHHLSHLRLHALASRRELNESRAKCRFFWRRLQWNMSSGGRGFGRSTPLKLNDYLSLHFTHSGLSNSHLQLKANWLQRPSHRREVTSPLGRQSDMKVQRINWGIYLA